MPTYLRTRVRTSVQTTDATVTTCGSYTLPDETTVMANAIIVAQQASSTNSAGYMVQATVKRHSAGSAAMVTGSPSAAITHEDDAAWACTIDVSGNDLRIRVTGVAATTIDWTSFLEVLVFTP